MEKQYCVYMHKNKINGKVYVGQTVHQDTPNERWKKGKGYKNYGSFWDDIQKYGWNTFEHIIVKKNLSLKESNDLEKELITHYLNLNMCYNKRIVGNNNKENKHYSQISKQKISKSVSKTQIGLIWLYKDDEEIQVKPEYLEEYLNKGYTKGRFFDKIWIHNDTKTKMIHKHELQKYLDNGWNKGRFRSSKEAKSMFKKGGDDYE